MNFGAIFLATETQVNETQLSIHSNQDIHTQETTNTERLNVPEILFVDFHHAEINEWFLKAKDKYLPMNIIKKNTTVSTFLVLSDQFYLGLF